MEFPNFELDVLSMSDVGLAELIRQLNYLNRDYSSVDKDQLAEWVEMLVMRAVSEPVQ